MIWMVKRKEKKCNNILQDILTNKEMLDIYCTRIRDSIMQNEGNMSPVYNEISFTISKDYCVKDREICDRVSVALITLIRGSVNRYEDLECRYHG